MGARCRPHAGIFESQTVPSHISPVLATLPGVSAAIMSAQRRKMELNNEAKQNCQLAWRPAGEKVALTLVELQKRAALIRLKR